MNNKQFDVLIVGSGRTQTARNNPPRDCRAITAVLR